jgi:hypothetical protein
MLEFYFFIFLFFSAQAFDSFCLKFFGQPSDALFLFGVTMVQIGPKNFRQKESKACAEKNKKMKK